MANQLLTTQELTRETLMPLENNLQYIPNVYDGYDDQFGRAGSKIGDTLFVRKPQRFVGVDGQAYVPEGLTDTQIPVTINQQSGVHFQFSSVERKLSLDEMKKRYLDNAGIAIANKLDYRGIQMATLNTANFVGTVGTTPGLNSTDAVDIYGTATQRLDEMGFNMNHERVSLWTPQMRRGYITFTKTLFHPGSALEKGLLKNKVPNALGLEIEVDQNINSITVGALGGTPAVNGAGQTGSTIILNGFSNNITNALLAGDILTFGTLASGTLAVGPQTPHDSTGSLQDFVVQQNASSDGSGNVTATIFPAIVPSGQYQNVTQSPPNGALVSVYHTAAAGQGAIAGLVSKQGLLFDRMAYCFVSVPLDVPDGVDMGMNTEAYSENESRMPVKLRFVRQYIGATDQWINRFDVIYGNAPLYPEGGCRIAGS